MEESLKNFLIWAHCNGVFIDKRVEFFSNKKSGNFAKVNDNVHESTELISIPKHLTIGPDLVSELFPGINYENPNSLSGNEMTILLISKLVFDQKCCNQKFRPYLDILPKKLNMPYFWKPEELDLLQNTDAGIIVQRNLEKLLDEWISLIEHLLEEKTHIDEEIQLRKELAFFNEYKTGSIKYNEIYSYLVKKEGSWYSFKIYLWSYGIVTSRGFPYILTSTDKSKDSLKKVILVPVLDLLNHSNNSKVKWTNSTEQNDNIIFQVNENLCKNNELYNNYGEKPNMELLINYGFVIENNYYDETTISIQIGDREKIEGAISLGIKFLEGSEEINDIQRLINGMNFKISNNDPLSSNLINFFAYLMQLRFENMEGITLRMKFHGLIELQRIINAKLSFFKMKCSSIGVENGDIIKMVKDYKNGQKKLFQSALDTLQQYEKKLLKNYKNDLTSFKSILKNDKNFMKVLSSHFGIKTYENILKKNILDNVFVLWIIRVSKQRSVLDHDLLSNSSFKKTLDFIGLQFDNVAKSIEITNEDIQENQSLYNSYFPELSKKYDIYSRTDCNISEFIIAQTVVDRISYIRQNNQELFIVQKVKVDLD